MRGALAVGLASFATVLAGCAHWQAGEYPKPTTELDGRGGLGSGANGEYRLYGCASADAEHEMDTLGASPAAPHDPHCRP